MLVLGPSAMPEPTVVEAGAAVKLAEAKPGPESEPELEAKP
eukprot:COSAG01_NODE_57429_length_312_cov_0.943662_1_plen_40_part_10